MNDAQWRVLDGEGNEQGPYSTEDLRGYFQSGHITQETMIWTEGLEEWVPARKVEGLLPDQPQAVQLATAAPAATTAAPAAAATPGFTLGGQQQSMTQSSGVTGKTPLPSWIGITTLVLGIAAIVLFFLPWTSISFDKKPFGEEGRITAFSQSGVQVITKGVSFNRDFLLLGLKGDGLSDEEAAKKADEMLAEAKGGDTDDLPYESSTLSMVALILVGVGAVLALIGLMNQLRTVLWIAHLSYIVAAVLISIQMAQQFPAPKKFMDQQREIHDMAMKIMEDVASENEKEQARQAFANAIQTKNEPSCYAVIGTLGLSMILLVIVLSSSGTPTVTIPQPGAGGQPAQPGGFTLQ